MVIGTARDVPRALEHPAVGAQWFQVCGVVTVAEDEDATTIRGQSDALHQLISSHRASVVLVAGPLGTAMMRAASDISQLHGCRLLAVMPSEVVAGHEPLVVWEGDAPLVQLAAHRRTEWQALLKRSIDIVLSATMLVVLAPLFAIIAAAIALESRGPVFFRHRRVGLRERAFHCLKFRTMVVDAEERLRRDPQLWATYREHGFRIPDNDDPRVTRLGRLLRRTSLDELPQLINVLRGDMSLIGPRPIVHEELEHYAGSERLLLSVRPGITGLWAVSGRHRLAYPDRAAVELGYVRTWSLRGDFAIAMRTVKAVADYGSVSAQR
ncbi:sugar transferase [Pseudogemmatithrix spongiicola]|uniref:Sugar transferase n=1 Tax=Pseudogemmatithrix spongiicola TaxID=3062599 RepID=A0AA49K0V0_9BACT|nr:sugar transferase [Gemmatimonadaceae bacterium 'strain 138']WKW15362.1 sugar transferase [Gemmatimonadaceae bacterium 'strain 318']